MDSPSDEESKVLGQHTDDSSTSEDQDRETPDSSSDSETSKKELSTLDLVKSAIENTEGENDDDTDGSSEDEKPKGEAASKDDEKPEGTDSDEMTDEEEKAWKAQLNVKTRKRFEQLQGKYRDTSDRLEKAEADAGWKANFDGFLEKNKISQNEANTLFDIGAAMKSDPKKALAALTPYYNQLLEVTGHILSPELREKVKNGYMTEQDARDLSTNRATNRGYEMRDRNNADQLAYDEATQQNQLVSDIQVALANLEASWQKSDPDYSMKSTRVRDNVKLMWHEAKRNNQMPRTVEQATRMVEKAKREVENEFRSYRPRKPIKAVDGGSSGPIKAEPANTMDVIKQTLGL